MQRFKLRNTKKCQDFLLYGRALKAIIGGWGHPSVAFGYYAFRLPKFRQLGFTLQDGSTFLIYPILMETPHPMCYTRKSLRSDPSSRLVVIGNDRS